MGDYSKLKSIELINFMGFAKAKAIFDESGSLNFKGYNSSGKSAFLTACAVAMMNAFPQKQTKYIRHGKDYFRITLAFDDGVVIVRDKYKNGQSLYEMYKGEKKVYTSKVGDKLSRIDAVPEVIENYLGMISTEIGYLNYQVRRDPLWLVETKGSENYYTLNEVLKSVEIAEANALLNADKNALNTDITIVESEYNTLNSQLLGMGSMGDELLGRLYDRRDIVNGFWSRYDALVSIDRMIESLNSSKPIPEVEKIDSSKLSDIQKISNMLSELKGIKYFEGELTAVDSDRYQSISKISKVVDDISDIRYFATEVTEIEGADKLKELNRLGTLVKQLSEAVKEVGSLNSEFQTLEEEREALISEAGKQGISFTVCTNCGTMLEVKSNG